MTPPRAIVMPGITIASAFVLLAQQPHAAFDVASIHPAAPQPGAEGSSRSRIEHSPTSISLRNIDLNECIQWAYNIPHFQITGRIPPERYDIRATAGGPVAVSQLRLMLQDLLATRFQLALHRERKPVAIYELVAAKSGPKLPPRNADDSQRPVRGHEFFPRVEGDSFVFEDVSLADFAGMLMQLRGIDLPIVDHTGIPGRYDLMLKSAPSATREADTSLLFALIQDQLGLRLVSGKAPMDVLVIDHAGKPSEN